jgi:hypothetical protein
MSHSARYPHRLQDRTLSTFYTSHTSERTKDLGLFLVFLWGFDTVSGGPPLEAFSFQRNASISISYHMEVLVICRQQLCIYHLLAHKI